MAWTYESYLGASYGISVALALITIFIVFLTLLCTHDLIELLVNSIIGIDLESANDPEASDLEVYHAKLSKKSTRYRFILILLYITTGLILSIMPVLIFEGCFLSNAYLLPSDNCPDDPMDCFVFLNSSTSTHVTSFSCAPGNSTQFPDNSSDAHASCFGWIIRRQTTRKVLDQVGICAGLIGLFGILLTFIVHIARQKVQIAVGIIVVSSAVLLTAIILFAYYKWALSLLTFASFALCMVVFTVGPVLAILVPKDKSAKTDNTQQMSLQDAVPPVVQERPASKNVTNVPLASGVKRRAQVYPAFQ